MNEQLAQILLKSSWDEKDISFLQENVRSLPPEAKQKLGIPTVIPTSSPSLVEEVKPPLSGEARVAKEIIAKQDEPPPKKKIGRPKKVASKK